MIVVLLGLGWGVLVASPIAVRARRVVSGARVSRLGPSDEARHPSRWAWIARVGERLPRPPQAVGHVLTGIGRRARTRSAERAIARELPVAVDLLSVAVASGCTPYLAVEVAARWAPPQVALALDGVRRASGLGRSFADSLAHVVDQTPGLAPVADALLVSDHFGAPVGDALTRLAAELRADLRRRAESRARTVPVRLLFPLVFLVLPAFALLTIVPAVAAGLAGS